MRTGPSARSLVPARHESRSGTIQTMRVFSGIRASGEKTLGNYSGGFRQYLATQEQAVREGGEAFFCVVDLHSITTPFEPETLRGKVLQVGRRRFVRLT